MPKNSEDMKKILESNMVHNIIDDNFLNMLCAKYDMHIIQLDLLYLLSIEVREEIQSVADYTKKKIKKLDDDIYILQRKLNANNFYKTLAKKICEIKVFSDLKIFYFVYFSEYINIINSMQSKIEMDEHDKLISRIHNLNTEGLWMKIKTIHEKILEKKKNMDDTFIHCFKFCVTPYDDLTPKDLKTIKEIIDTIADKYYIEYIDKSESSLNNLKDISHDMDVFGINYFESSSDIIDDNIASSSISHISADGISSSDNISEFLSENEDVYDIFTIDDIKKNEKKNDIKKLFLQYNLKCDYIDNTSESQNFTDAFIYSGKIKSYQQYNDIIINVLTNKKNDKTYIKMPSISYAVSTYYTLLEHKNKNFISFSKLLDQMAMTRKIPINIPEFLILMIMSKELDINIGIYTYTSKNVIHKTISNNTTVGASNVSFFVYDEKNIYCVTQNSNINYSSSTNNSTNNTNSINRANYVNHVYKTNYTNYDVNNYKKTWNNTYSPYTTTNYTPEITVNDVNYIVRI